jgi:hypothetical protein
LALRITLVIVAAILLVAHFLRQGEFILMLLCMLTPLLLLIKKRWSLFALQLLMYLDATIWLITTIKIVQERIFFGEAWVRLVIILGAVILFTIVAGLLLNSSIIKEKYPD